MDYKRVIDDYMNGTINPLEYKILIDRDGGCWRCIDPKIDDESVREELAYEMSKKYGSPGGYRDLVDILTAAGVNADWS